MGQCSVTVQMAPAAINKNPASVSDDTDRATIAAARPTAAPISRMVLPTQTGIRNRANARNAAPSMRPI